MRQFDWHITQNNETMEAPQNRRFFLQTPSFNPLAHLYRWKEDNICQIIWDKSEVVGFLGIRAPCRMELLSMGLILVKPMTKDFTKCKDLLGFFVKLWFFLWSRLGEYDGENLLKMSVSKKYIVMLPSPPALHVGKFNTWYHAFLKH
jgi:hypothetical protein